MAQLGWEIEFEQLSERVKSVDLHPTHPWILASFYSGALRIWDYDSKTMLRSFQASELPVRSAKFVARQRWVVAGGDDGWIRAYGYHDDDDGGTTAIEAFEAHGDYIRSVAVHPTLPYVLSAADDMLIKLWDWDNGWACARVFEGHSHYVMQVAFNPNARTTFASASLDRTAKIWSLGSPDAEFTLRGHQRGLNCVGYLASGGADHRPYLITGSDDFTAKVWDYQTRSCLHTLEGHTHNLSAVSFHPELPLIVTGSEDGTLRVWDSTTYSLENTLNYGLGRVWTLGCREGSTRVVIGYDEGTIMIQTGGQVPAGGAGSEAPDDQLQTSVNSCVSCNNSALPI